MRKQSSMSYYIFFFEVNTLFQRIIRVSRIVQSYSFARFYISSSNFYSHVEFCRRRYCFLHTHNNFWLVFRGFNIALLSAFSCESSENIRWVTGYVSHKVIKYNVTLEAVDEEKLAPEHDNDILDVIKYIIDIKEVFVSIHFICIFIWGKCFGFSLFCALFLAIVSRANANVIR